MTGVANEGPFLRGTPWPDPEPAAQHSHADPWLRSGIDGEAAPVAPQPVRPKSLPKLLAQGKYWRRADGGWVRVKDMHPAHRANAARMLLRDAAEYAQQVAVAELLFTFDTPAEVVEATYVADRERSFDPEGWMRGTKLYRRLVKGLPTDHVVPPEANEAATARAATGHATAADALRRVGELLYEDAPQALSIVEQVAREMGVKL